MFRRICFTSLVFCMCLGGCEEYRYAIEMKPHGDKIERKISVSDNVSSEIWKEIIALYPPPTDANSLKGTFSGNLPNDIGCVGSYLSYATSMGSVYFYSERFRGTDDLVGKQEKMEHYADMLIDLLIEWLETELGDDPDFEKLRRFCDKNLRNDIKNLTLFNLLSDIVSTYSTEIPEYEFMVRGAQYLAERGYFEHRDLPKLYYHLDQEEEGVLYLARNLIASKMGYESESDISESLHFLSSPEEIEKSFKHYLPISQSFYQYCQTKKLQSDETEIEIIDSDKFVEFILLDPDHVLDLDEFLTGGYDPNAFPMELDKFLEILHDYPEAYTADFDFLFELFSGAIGGEIDFSSDHDEITVKFSCDNKPFATNGKWDEQTKQLGWSRSFIHKADHEYPMMCYAFWSSPEEKFQQEHLGKIVLTGEDLSEYCLWRENLDEQQGRQWDDFLCSLGGGDNLIQKLEAFSFSEPTGLKKQEIPSISPEKPIQLIKNALKEANEKAKQPTKTIQKTKKNKSQPPEKQKPQKQ